MPQATIVGSGPNGLAAGLALGRAGYRVRMLEAATDPGGGLRTQALTLPGFAHDVCSAVHPAALASPLLRAWGVRERVEWIVPEISYAHPLEDGRAALAWRDLERTASGLGADADRWQRLFAPLVSDLDAVVEVTGSSLLRVPRHPFTALHYGRRMLRTGLRTPEAQALWAGVAAHANSRLPSLASAAAGLLLATHAHASGWAYPRGGAGQLARAMAADIRSRGGTIETGTAVTDLASLDWGDPAHGDVLLLAGSPRLLLTHPALPAGYARALRRFRYGSAAAKVDFALGGPVPWLNADVARSPTVHLGGSRAEIRASENAVARGRVSPRPYVLVVQPSVLDDSRAPEGQASLWAYIHVPAGSGLDPTALVTAQLERFAPGFAQRVLASTATAASAREAINPAEIGGDVFGGEFSLWQSVKRPVVAASPWRTPLPGIYLASASTPPGPGVHGMGGWHAARTVLVDAGTPSTLDELFRPR